VIARLKERRRRARFAAALRHVQGPMTPQIAADDVLAETAMNACRVEHSKKGRSFTAAFAARVLKKGHATILSSMAKNAVGNQLFERRILFHLVARKIISDLRIEDPVEVPRGVGAEALEVTAFLKDRGWND
jgi:hypothetical protein